MNSRGDEGESPHQTEVCWKFDEIAPSDEHDNVDEICGRSSTASVATILTFSNLLNLATALLAQTGVH